MLELSFTKNWGGFEPVGLNMHVVYTKTCIFWLMLMVSVGKYHINGCFGYC